MRLLHPSCLSKLALAAFAITCLEFSDFATPPLCPASRRFSLISSHFFVSRDICADMKLNAMLAAGGRPMGSVPSEANATRPLKSRPASSSVSRSRCCPISAYKTKLFFSLIICPPIHNRLPRHLQQCLLCGLADLPNFSRTVVHLTDKCLSISGTFWKKIPVFAIRHNDSAGFTFTLDLPP